ncbi:dihydroorotase [Polymorphobacter arshaanensis]|uniref:Dihydroorotase n=1 Tax=Glacieibacterium arshaanense TaxID=2511025 RepID=A0A4Y9ER74_9SPHN|nr:dihydroorotase [Polymorphobacter arshaanensis]TFU06131.1 dihydroorotase [Polymorphobacter arshaanensis]
MSNGHPVTAFINTQLGSVLVADREIVAVGAVELPSDCQIIDAEGLTIAPGLIDAGVFKADWRACHAGGITRVMLMPDQNPPLDNPAMIGFAWGATKPHIWVHPLAAATRGLLGAELAEIGLCQAAGAVGVATGRAGIADSGVMYRLMQYAAGFDLVVVSHAEDATLTGDAVATDGEVATRLGLPAAPAFAEALAVARDLRIAEATGARLHFRQVTTAESIALVRAAKARGVAVTCGVTPGHFLMSEQSVSGYRSFARLSPPLRSEDDRQAVLAGLADGTIDCIASGHDPRSQEDKRLPFADAEPGMIGAETLLALALTLVRDGRMTQDALLATMTANPARIFGLPAGHIAPGQPADLMLFDAGAPWRIDADATLASAGNTPFDGMPTQGRVALTMKGGETVWRRA